MKVLLANYTPLSVLVIATRMYIALPESHQFIFSDVVEKN